MVQAATETQVSVGGLMADSVAESAIKYTTDVNIKEGKMAASSHLYGEQGVPMQNVHVVKELLQLA